MVCVPCFMIPVLLIVWRFIQPFVLRFWNPWEVKDNKDGVGGKRALKSPFTCTNCVETKDEDGNVVQQCLRPEQLETEEDGENSTHLKSS